MTEKVNEQLKKENNTLNENAAQKKNEVSQLVTLIVVGLFFVVMGILLVILPKKEFSENENRNLAVFPEVSVNAIVEGKFTEGLNTYLEDHFPARDFWISVKTETEILIGRREMNGVFIGNDGYLFGHYEEPQNNQRIIEAYNKLANGVNESGRDIDMKLMLIPTSAAIYSDKLPFGAEMADQLKARTEIADNSGIDFIDCLDLLVENKDKYQLYYRTDHHWTTMGAYWGYMSYCQGASLTPASLEDFEAQVVTDDFHGTYSSKVNQPLEKGDEITVYYDKKASLTVTYEDPKETVVTDTLYNLDYVEVKDKYSLFLNNLHASITVENMNAETDRVLLLVKDSYANSMVPFLIHNYKTIYILDTRYYKYGPNKFITDHQDITDILVLYNMGTIDNDAGIRAIF